VNELVSLKLDLNLNLKLMGMVIPSKGLELPSRFRMEFKEWKIRARCQQLYVSQVEAWSVVA